MRVLCSIVVACVLLGIASGASVGDVLLRPFGAFDNQPLTMAEASAKGFKNVTGKCVPGMGIMMSTENGGPTRSTPTFLLFTAAGQLAGFGSYAWGEPAETLEPRFWRTTDQRGVYSISARTRNADMICSGRFESEPIGNMLVVGDLNVPLTMGEAHDADWMFGNCIRKMGIHHSFDLQSPSTDTMTWKAENLAPVLPMYNSLTLKISAILFNIWNVQIGLPVGQWEGPIPDALFCSNWCADSGCHFDGATMWSTQHWMFSDPMLNDCSQAECVFN